MTALPAQAEADAEPQGVWRAAAIAAVLAAMGMVVLNAAVANVALPTIARSLQVTPALSVRVVIAYQTALVMALLPCAALGESLGYRRVFTGGVALFTAASALCALAPSLAWLVAARFLQGLGGAGVMALGVALLRFTVPHGQLGAAIGWNALTVALSSAAGPTVGAAILSVGSWPWLFAVNLPLGVAVVALAGRALPRVAGTGRPLDLLSVALNAGGFAALVVGAELAPERPALAVALLVAAVLGLAALVRREAPRSAPLIPLDLLRAASFRLSVIASVCCFAGQAAGMVALPFYLQHALGRGALATGLYITPWPLTVAVAAPIAGRLANRVPTGWLCAAGGACLSTGLAAAALWPLRGDPRPLVPIVMLCGLGFGLFQTPNNRNMFLAAPRERSGAAGGLQGTARLAGQTLGAVVMTLLFALAPVDAAPRIGLGIGAVLALAAGLVSAGRGGS
ncbi:MFS transporter [Vitiosangium sp. GDMCC 1.1324]|uniref:MFS transporter n=1 Tax=Vitiosangium sp. (strain GDMCC 1.1324) TaxID=2138576 RepID=UPI000D3DA089|nr:MFS transporter [Vitiosangium sp. GDMCC 1.1324]PTL85005.1 MFS transporter [Vitiosangium sp. GDMCC 1.1324]